MAQVIFGPYPMTITQLNAWGQTAVSELTLKEVGRALDMLERTITIRPEPKEWR